ncbi:MAG: gliding motility-associated C-terminal domain-containing protein [Bacteroidales bacterium]|nr:gliding motility-associated C-terminal domain-containing protein [Bacteroidales bacterium]
MSSRLMPYLSYPISFLIGEFLLYMLLGKPAYSQPLTGTISTYVNKDCMGRGCEYNGPTILINEIMLMPSIVYDGSIVGQQFGQTNPSQGEWIELYNPHKCEAADISCYFLGNNAHDVSGGDIWNYTFEDYPGGFSIPPGTVVPPQGFAIIRGVNAPAVPANLLVANGGNVVEVEVNSRYCFGGGNRLWFPNAGGWFAFYDQNGVPQDAVSWTINDNASCFSCQPCIPSVSDCGYNGTLASYNQIPSNRKNQISTNQPTENLSLRRIPDGGNWAVNQPAAATYGTCNSTCENPPIITCNGTAVVHVSGGTPPYTYRWNDTLHQTTDSAVGLCMGDYSVLVHDATGASITLTCHIDNYIPPVTHPDVNICRSQLPFTLTGGSPSDGSYQGGWINGSQITTNTMGTSAATYTFTDTNGCVGSTSFNITVADSIKTTDSITLCSYELPYTLQAANTTLGRNTPEHSKLTYTLNNQAGCDSIVTLKIRIIDAQLSIITPSEDYCTDYMEVLQATSTFNNYVWSTGETGSVITVTKPGTYSVTSSFDKCSLTKSHTVSPCSLNLYLPNAITPSKPDGHNDFFAIPYGIQNQINDFTILIFNRWGECVFSSKDVNFKWYGEKNNHIRPNNVYTYKITCTDFDHSEYIFTGTITVL